ncbi:MAG: hypothetical protein WCB67_17380 [Solirubrobacteraceae bacterium]
MTIALNIIFAIIVLAAVVGMLAHSIKASHAQRKLHVARANARPATAKSRSTGRRRAYGPLTGARA